MSQHHDPVHPDSGHLTAELIADLSEGLLDDESAQHAQRHLDQCAVCQHVKQSLADVAAILGGLTPPAMPDDVLARLLTSVAAADDTDEIHEGKQPVGTARVVALDAERTRRRGWAGPTLGVAASVAGILLVGALVYPALTGSSDDATTAASAGDRSNDLSTADSTDVPLSFAASRTRTRYESKRIDRQVNALVERDPSPVMDSSGTFADNGAIESAPSITPSLPASQFQTSDGVAGMALGKVPMATDPAAAQACVEQYLGSGVEPLAIDLGSFKIEDTGEWVPAAVIVLPVTNQPDRATVLVFGADCASADVIPLYLKVVALTTSN